MSQEVSVIVLIEVQPGKRKEQIEAFNKLSPQVLAEDGCLQYELKQNNNSENQFVLLEKWESEEALSAHDKTAHMVASDEKNSSFRAKPATVLMLSNI